MAFSSKPAARRSCGQMMGQTDRLTDRQTGGRTERRSAVSYTPLRLYYASSVNKGIVEHLKLDF